MTVEVVGRDEERARPRPRSARGRTGADRARARRWRGSASRRSGARPSRTRAGAGSALSSRPAESAACSPTPGSATCSTALSTRCFRPSRRHRRRALEVALLVEDAADAPVDARALGVAGPQRAGASGRERRRRRDRRPAVARRFVRERAGVRAQALPEARLALLWTRRLGERGERTSRPRARGEDCADPRRPAQCRRGAPPPASSSRHGPASRPTLPSCTTRPPAIRCTRSSPRVRSATTTTNGIFVAAAAGAAAWSRSSCRPGSRTSAARRARRSSWPRGRPAHGPDLLAAGIDLNALAPALDAGGRARARCQLHASAARVGARRPRGEERRGASLRARTGRRRPACACPPPRALNGRPGRSWPQLWSGRRRGPATSAPLAVTPRPPASMRSSADAGR